MGRIDLTLQDFGRAGFWPRKILARALDAVNQEQLVKNFKDSMHRATGITYSSDEAAWAAFVSTGCLAEVQRRCEPKAGTYFCAFHETVYIWLMNRRVLTKLL